MSNSSRENRVASLKGLIVGVSLVLIATGGTSAEIESARPRPPSPQLRARSAQDSIDEQEFDSTVIQTWRDAGAESGYLVVSPWDCIWHATRPVQVARDFQVVPAFRFQEFPTREGRELPIPQIDFGLDLRETDTSDRDLIAIRRLERLRVLHLDETRVTDEGLKAIGNMQIERLVVPKEARTETGLENFISAINPPTYLDLRGWRIADKDLSLIANMMQLSHLRLMRTAITDEGLESLRQLNRLKVLDLSFTQVTDGGVRHLAAFVNLRELILGGTAVTDTGIAQLEANPMLTVLALDGLRVTDESVSSIANQKDLIELSLSYTLVSDAGMEELASLDNLRVLSLVRTDLTDAGVAHLSSLTNLERLDLRRTKITDASIETLARLRQLDLLVVSETMISEEGLKELKSRLPACHIR